METLAQVLASPRSNAARRALADAGDPRAPLIRAQLTMWEEHRAGRIGRPTYNAASAEATKLVNANARKWAGDVPRYVDAWAFQRGLVSDVTVSCDRLVDSFDELCRIAPLQHLRLRAPFKEFGRLVTHPRFAQIVSLEVEGQTDFGDRELFALARSVKSSGIRWLGLTRTSVGRLGLEALAASPHHTWLQVVSYDGPWNPISRIWDDSGVKSAEPRAEGRELQSLYGQRAWIDPPVAKLDIWPPHSEQLAAE